MTLKEIAEEVGVSISTVSRVVNTRSRNAASPEIQQAIWDCVRKTGYIPSRSSRKAEKGDDASKDEGPLKIIACVFARNNMTVNDNTYFNGMVKCFERTALALNYVTQQHFTAIELNTRNIEMLTSQHIDGIIVIGRHDSQLIDSLSKQVPNIIYAGLAHPANNQYDAVICDRYSIGETATQYLIDKGHTKIAYIGETENEITYNGYLSTLAASNITPDPDYTVSLYASMENGYIGMKKLIESKNRPTGVFCMNDYIAVGALKAIHDSGLRCPEDISVIGVDNIEAASFTTPKLTTIHTPMEELGQIASKILIDRIEGGHTISMKVSLPFRLVERESCASLTKIK